MQLACPAFAFSQVLPERAVDARRQEAGRQHRDLLVEHVRQGVAGQFAEGLVHVFNGPVKVGDHHRSRAVRHGISQNIRQLVTRPVVRGPAMCRQPLFHAFSIKETERRVNG